MVGSIVNTGEASFLMLNAVKSDDPAWGRPARVFKIG
jgi:hypothetical protein